MSHGQVDERFACMGQFLIILAQTAIIIQPAKGTLDDPTARQDLKALGIVIALDHLPQPTKSGFNPLGKGVAAIATIGPEQLQTGLVACSEYQLFMGYLSETMAL